ncbi:MAG: DUF4381 domain-containing protein [Gammaproteobacteria bacterium]
MEAEDPLSQLRDIHLPEPMTFWPPAPGWWFVLLLILIGLVFLYRHAIAALLQRRKLAAVLRELDAALDHYNETAAFENTQNQAGLDYLAAVNILLKRVVLVLYPDSNATHLTGRPWLEFLDTEGGTNAFTTGEGAILADGIYRKEFDADAAALHEVSRHWITRAYNSVQVQTSPMAGFFKRRKELAN